MSPHNHSVAFAESERRIIDSANPGGTFYDGIKDRLHVRGGAANNAEHLGRRRLMFQRLSQFRVALLDFLEQPNVLDGDDGLRSERLKQSYFPVAKWANLLSAHMDCADGNTLPQ